MGHNANRTFGSTKIDNRSYMSSNIYFSVTGSGAAIFPIDAEVFKVRGCIIHVHAVGTSPTIDLEMYDPVATADVDAYIEHTQLTPTAGSMIFMSPKTGESGSMDDSTQAFTVGELFKLTLAKDGVFSIRANDPRVENTSGVWPRLVLASTTNPIVGWAKLVYDIIVPKFR